MTRHGERRVGLSPTQALAVACAGRVGDATAAMRVKRAASDDVAWEAVPELLRRHGLRVMGAVHLANAAPAMPSAVRAEIQAGALSDRAQSLGMTAELLRVSRALAADGVNALPFKGPALACDAYGDAAARPFFDLDLLVEPSRLTAAERTLAALGYVAAYRLSPAREQWFRRVDGDYPFTEPAHGTLLELHVRPLSRRFGGSVETEALWARRRAIDLSGETVAALGADDTLYLHLLHGAKHRWERLEWIAVTDRLLEQRAGSVVALLRPPYANRRAVLVGCLLATELLGAPIDGDTRAAIAADRRVRSLADAALAHLFAERAAGDEDTPGKIQFNFRVQEGVVARLRYAERWAFWPSPEDWAAVSLPDAAFPLYRVLRPLRLLRRYARRGVRFSSRGARA